MTLPAVLVARSRFWTNPVILPALLIAPSALVPLRGPAVSPVGVLISLVP